MRAPTKAIPPLSDKDKKRFFENISPPNKNGCTLWKRSTRGHYGSMRVNGLSFSTHRLAWSIANNHPIGDLFICHKCDVPRCCNPEHLFIGTGIDNMNDRNKKGRTATGLRCGAHTHPEKRAKGERQHLSKLTDLQILEIRQRYKKGETTRSIGRVFGITSSTVSKIGLRQTWAHI